MTYSHTLTKYNPWLSEGVKPHFGFSRIINQTGEAQTKSTQDIIKHSMMLAATLLVQSHLLGKSLPRPKGLDEVRRSDWFEVAKWMYRLSNEAQPHRRRHPMVKYYESIMAEYNSDEVEAGLRNFLSLYQQVQAEEKPDDEAKTR